MPAPRRIDWSVQPLGEISDRELARRLGVNHRSVAVARRARHIRPFDPRVRAQRRLGRVMLEPDVLRLLDEHDLGKHGLTRIANEALRIVLGEPLPRKLRERMLVVLRAPRDTDAPG